MPQPMLPQDRAQNSTLHVDLTRRRTFLLPLPLKRANVSRGNLPKEEIAKYRGQVTHLESVDFACAFAPMRATCQPRLPPPLWLTPRARFPLVRNRRSCPGLHPALLHSNAPA